MENYTHNFEFSGELNYIVSLPKEKIDTPPMIVFLHGAGERGKDVEKLYTHAIPKYLKEGMDIPAVVLCPQCPSNMVWNNLCFPLKNLIDEVAEKYNVNKRKITITGISMGGFGSWDMGLNFPEYFAAIAPVCGGGLSWRCERLKNMPIWAFHGDIDPTVPLKNSVEMVDSVNAKGGNAKLTIFHNVDHFSWDCAYLDTKVIEWLLNQERTDVEKVAEPFVDEN